jgi:hypothetical protein
MRGREVRGYWRIPRTCQTHTHPNSKLQLYVPFFSLVFSTERPRLQSLFSICAIVAGRTGWTSTSNAHLPWAMRQPIETAAEAAELRDKVVRQRALRREGAGVGYGALRAPPHKAMT